MGQHNKDTQVQYKRGQTRDNWNQDQLINWSQNHV